MIYVFFALLAGLAWALCFILQWSWWIALIATGVLLLLAIFFGLFKFIRARRAGAALENAIAEQGRQQAMNAAPERRAEIQALQKQIQDGISALKSSKLAGKNRGGSALYALPWYAIVGPPGAGKTTALKHSGLVFPYADDAVRGVGGTRNCDWWFTNDAILLDTAGRYATEHSDQQEWLAFLDMLRKYRPDKPLNGLIIAVSVTDIIDASDAQVEEMGKKLRARIDEVMTKLRMTLPVYFLVTKCDLIAGFTEFFGDLRRSERAQAWGATLMLKENKNDPGGLFAREFDTLVQQIHARSMKRLAFERNREAREAIYQFPLEFAGIKRNLQDLLTQVFMVNAFQGTPTFRGVYFTSGTQEGTPLNRVLQRMGQAMGIQPTQHSSQPKVESKSYFLHDVFTKVMFPDADIAARSAAEVRRKKLVRIGVSATALAVAVMFAIPSIVSYSNNTSLLKTGKARAKKASKIDWASTAPISGKLTRMSPLLKILKELDEYRDKGVPFNKRFLMYSGDKIQSPLRKLYVANMQKGFVSPCKFFLERQLNAIKGKKYAQERLALKTYLMLSDVTNLDVEWATGKYTALWAQLQKATTDVPIATLKERMRPLVHYYFQLIKPDGGKARARPVAANAKIVAHARKVLQAVPVSDRYYAMFVDSVQHELYDPMRDVERSNLQYPPVSLDAMFTDRPEVTKKWITSRKFKKSKKYYEVLGPYTEKGHHRVLGNIKLASKLLEREQWVVPLTREERGDRVAANVIELAKSYERRYIAAWRGFLLDLKVRQPDNLKEAIVEYKALLKPEWPYLRILRALEDHTQWKGKTLNKGAGNIANRKIKSKIMAKTGLRVNVDVNKIAGRASLVPAAFKKTVAFGVLQSQQRGPLNETNLAKYLELLGKLRSKMLDETRATPDASPNVIVQDLNKAKDEAEKMLKDPLAKETILPLLLLPLNIAGKLRLPATIAVREKG